MLKDQVHTAVLVDEVVRYLNVQPDQRFLDTTLGGGGHAKAILEAGGEVVGIDQDPEAIEIAKLSSLKGINRDRYKLVVGRFSKLNQIMKQAGWDMVDGVLMDLGISMNQLRAPQRGFSYQTEGPLDMRISPETQVTAADLINGLTEGELTELMQRFGEVPRAKQIARAIVQTRSQQPIRTTQQLRSVVEQVRYPGWKRRVKPVTLVFQALRIAVNDELTELQQGLRAAEGVLRSGGRLVVIAFHSIEDRVVKDFMRGTDSWELLTKKPVRPSIQELSLNPSARSARLRAAVKK